MYNFIFLMLYCNVFNVVTFFSRKDYSDSDSAWFILVHPGTPPQNWSVGRQYCLHLMSFYQK